MIKLEGAPSQVCAHTEHLFSNPLCEKEPLWKRICMVAFHILTLCIPLIIYNCCFSEATIEEEPTKKEKKSKHKEDPSTHEAGKTGGETGNDPLAYSDLGKEAIRFAVAKLIEHAELESFAGFLTQPQNVTISRLTTLYHKMGDKFADLLTANKDHPWDSDAIRAELMDTADALIKISFAISNLTLDELKAHPTPNRTMIETLTGQSTYHYRTFFYCTEVYHWCRGMIAWHAAGTKGMSDGLYPAYADQIPQSYSDPYYQKGTAQNTWNKLYNEYCARVRALVNEEELHRKDRRFTLWTEKDTSAPPFRPSPTSLPT